MPFICPICNGIYFIGGECACTKRKEKEQDEIPLGEKIKEALEEIKKENDDD